MAAQALKELIGRIAVKFMRLHDIATPSEGKAAHGGASSGGGGNGGGVGGGNGGASPGLTDGEILEYLLRRPLPTDKPLGPKCARQKPYDLQMLNLAHDLLNTFLPHALKKIDRVTFGIMSAADIHFARKENPAMPLSRTKLAIPFVSKDVPSPASEFAQPDVVIALTTMGYRHEGLRFADFKEGLEKLQQLFQTEGGPKAERPSAVLYTAWIEAEGGSVCASSSAAGGGSGGGGGGPDRGGGGGGGGEAGGAASPSSAADSHNRHLPLELLDRSDERQTKPLYELLRASAEFIHWYLDVMVFPKFMRFQEHKLSASGQDIGGRMLFSRRVAFSGTPSELLPHSLGTCHFEPGSEGEILHTLTVPEIVSFHHLRDSWSPRSLLAYIAESNRFHALIDTGALITGLSNVEVARYLVSEPRYLRGIDGVVYLDEFDRKMIYMRSGGASMRLEEASCRLERRFAFYDQMHTTGMDIKHCIAARAALTLGKDLTWRDYAQGAYRMRGIGKGQRIELLITPEIRQLMRTDLCKVVVRRRRRGGGGGEGAATAGRAASEADAAATPAPPSDDREVAAWESDASELPRCVAAWLQLQQLRSEKIQYVMLQFQNLADVWRRPAAATLLQTYSRAMHSELSEATFDALGCFKEPVDMAIVGAVPRPALLREVLQARQDENARWLTTAEQHAAIDYVRGALAGMFHERSDQSASLDIEQQLEQETEQEQEQELEQHTEIEKFVELDYSREDEAPTPWRFADLRHLSGPEGNFFYNASQFKLHRGTSLLMPSRAMGVGGHKSIGVEDLRMSTNYFNRRWSGDRRLRNLAMVLEWVPRHASAHQGVAALEPELQEKLRLCLDRVWELYVQEGESALTRANVRLLLFEAFDRHLSEQELQEDFALLHSALRGGGGQGGGGQGGGPARRPGGNGRQRQRQWQRRQRRPPHARGARAAAPEPQAPARRQRAPVCHRVARRGGDDPSDLARPERPPGARRRRDDPRPAQHQQRRHPDGHELRLQGRPALPARGRRADVPLPRRPAPVQQERAVDPPQGAAAQHVHDAPGLLRAHVGLPAARGREHVDRPADRGRAPRLCERVRPPPAAHAGAGRPHRHRGPRPRAARGVQQV